MQIERTPQRGRHSLPHSPLLSRGTDMKGALPSVVLRLRPTATGLGREGRRRPRVGKLPPAAAAASTAPRSAAFPANEQGGKMCSVFVRGARSKVLSPMSVGQPIGDATFNSNL